MPALFENASIGNLTLANRFVRSATWEGLADPDGNPTPDLTRLFVELAENDLGLIISGYAYVSANAQSSPRQLAIHKDQYIQPLGDMVDAVHKAKGKIALQVVHAGANAIQKLTGLSNISPATASSQQLSRIIADFASAARRAADAGFDAVQIHAAHGFLLSQFLSPHFNPRTDTFGRDSLQNRARLLLEVVRAVRNAVGRDFPILVKLNSEDFIDNGMTRQESAQVGMWLQEASANAIELSGGTVASSPEYLPVRTKSDGVYYREAARLFKQKVQIPIILVGGIRSYETADELIQNRLADFIALARPLIGEPDLIKRWKNGNRTPSECESCNDCFLPAEEGRGIGCSRGLRDSAKP